jgi:hypothetical protein
MESIIFTNTFKKNNFIIYNYLTCLFNFNIISLKLQKKGKGTFYWADGNRYDGDFKDDKFTEKGTIYFADGDRYEGDWKDGKKHGKGTFCLADGNR